MKDLLFEKIINDINNIIVKIFQFLMNYLNLHIK